jgi:hypothetical protein
VPATAWIKLLFITSAFARLPRNAQGTSGKHCTRLAYSDWAGLQESLSRVLSVRREVRRDERQEPADWRSTREGFVAIKGRAKRFAPTAANPLRPELPNR